MEQQPPNTGVKRMPTRFETVAAHNAAGTLPRAMEVNATEDCTVDGSTHTKITPAHSSGVSRCGTNARAPRPRAGNRGMC